MSISNVVQRGSVIYVYGERNQVLFMKSASNRPGDGVKGYTSGSVSIQSGSSIYTYDEHGSVIGTTST
jgi:hypothetical protein